MTKNTTILMIATIASFVMFAPLNEAFASGELYVATDNEEFTGTTPPDRIAKMITNGPLVISTQIIVTDYPVNGLGDGGDFMFAGTPSQATLRTIDWDGNLLTTVPAGWSSSCCSEDMAFDPVPQIGSPNGILYHAHFSDNIQAVDPIDPTIVFDTFAQNSVVGMAHVDGDIWISKWTTANSVGTWDPATNTYTPVFGTPDLAGMLAYDPEDEILWVGLRGGQIIPYDLLGNQLGPAHSPFGALPNTIDGGVFRGESDVFEKTLVEDLAKSDIECTTGMLIGATTTTMCTFSIEYHGESLLIVDTVPAEWEFVSQTGSCTIEKAGKGNPSKSATIIDCGVTDSLSEEFKFQTRQSPGKGHKVAIYAPTSCDKDLKLNEGALALDPTTLEVIKTSNMIGTPTVDDPNDVDCDQVEDNKDNCPAIANRDQLDWDNDGLGDACDLDDDNDGIPDAEENSGCRLDSDLACGVV